MAAEMIHPSMTQGPPNVMGVPTLIFAVVLIPFLLLAFLWFFFQFWYGMIGDGVLAFVAVGLVVWYFGGDPYKLQDWLHSRDVAVELEASSNLRSITTNHQ